MAIRCHKEYTLYGYNLRNTVVVSFDIYMKWNSYYSLFPTYMFHVLYKAKKIRKNIHLTLRDSHANYMITNVWSLQRK